MRASDHPALSTSNDSAFVLSCARRHKCLTTIASTAVAKHSRLLAKVETQPFCSPAVPLSGRHHLANNRRCRDYRASVLASGLRCRICRGSAQLHRNVRTGYQKNVTTGSCNYSRPFASAQPKGKSISARCASPSVLYWLFC